MKRIRGFDSGGKWAGALAMLLGVGIAAPAEGQTLEYYFQERGGNITEPDAAVATAFYYDAGAPSGDQRWHYAAGYVTEYDGSNSPHKRLVVYRFDADVATTAPRSQPPPISVTFPATGDPAGQHAATDIFVDEAGYVYVCGYTTIETGGDESSTDINYVVLKYNKALEPEWEGLTGGTAPNYNPNDEARIYDGTASGDGEDIAVSLAVSPVDGSVMVTGTSAGNGTGKDVVSLLLFDDGDYNHTEWPSGGGYEGAGIRRFHGGVGDDVAAELAYIHIASPDAPVGIWMYVVGSTYQGSGENTNILALRYGDDGSLSSQAGGWYRTDYDGDAHGNDYGTGLATMKGEAVLLWVCGTSDMESAPVDDTDFWTLHLDESDGDMLWEDVLEWNGGLDHAADIAVQPGQGGSHTYVWVTGRATLSSAEACATVAYDHDQDGLLVGYDQYQFSSGLEARGEAVHGTPYAHVAGRAKSGVTDHDALVIRYEIDLMAQDPPYLIRTWLVRVPDGTETGFDTALAVTADNATGDVFCAGQGTQSTYGADFVGMRITQD